MLVNPKEIADSYQEDGDRVLLITAINSLTKSFMDLCRICAILQYFQTMRLQVRGVMRSFRFKFIATYGGSSISAELVLVLLRVSLMGEQAQAGSGRLRQGGGKK